MAAPLCGDGRGQSCHWCKRVLQSTRAQGSSVQATREHLYPKSLGGTYRVWCCAACNNLKGNLRPNEWRAFMAANPNWWKGYRGRRRAKPATIGDLRPEAAWELAREIVRQQFKLALRPLPAGDYPRPPIGPVDIFE